MTKERYLFQLNKELLDLRCIEMDSVCKRLFAGMDTVRLAHGGDTRDFNIDWKNEVIAGRGIIGFFRDIPEGRMFIERDGQDAYNIIPPEQGFRGVADKTTQTATDKTTYVMSGRDLEVLEQMSSFASSGETWMNAYQNAAALKTAGRREDLLCLNYLGRIEKYGYQIETVTRVFNDFRGRAILADEVGLGKTIEAGIAMSEYLMRGLVRNILILTPASLVDQWYMEMKTLFNQDFIRSDDPAFKKDGAGAWKNHKKIIASISGAKRKGSSEHIINTPYDMVIVDEAHHLKNRNSVAWQFVNAINKKYMLLLSATPVQNSLEELYNLITLIRPGQLRTYSYFKKTFIADKSGLEVKNRAKLNDLMASAMIRNRRSQVDVKFTKRFATTKIIKSAEAEKALYDDISNFVRREYDAGNLSRMSLKNVQERIGSCPYAATLSIQSILNGEKLTGSALDQMAGFFEKGELLARDPSKKMFALASLLREFDDAMIVFTKYRATLDALSIFLRGEGFTVAEFYGGMRRAEKEEQIQSFRDGARVLVSTETGGEGRNLQFCNGLVNFDLPWNPMAIEQRIGRIHRIGQDRDVYVFNLCAEDTVEYHILNILDKKINMFELAVGEVDMILGNHEEEQDFSEIIMEYWARSVNNEQMEREMDVLGERLLLNKQHLERIKKLEDALFEC